jgi:hypothetical protein
MSTRRAPLLARAHAAALTPPPGWLSAYPRPLAMQATKCLHLRCSSGQELVLTNSHGPQEARRPSWLPGVE